MNSISELKKEEAKKVNDAVEKFLANGGRIEVIPYGVQKDVEHKPKRFGDFVYAGGQSVWT